MDKEQQKKIITDIMNEDAKDGLYKKQTSVEWLIEKVVQDQLDRDISHRDWLEIFEKAKQMYNDEMMDRYGEGYDEGLYDGLNK